MKDLLLSGIDLAWRPTCVSPAEKRYLPRVPLELVVTLRVIPPQRGGGTDTGVTTVTDVFGLSHKDTSPVRPARPKHEQVVFCADERSGLRAIIAIYTTALGPSLGGTRFYPYESEQAALADVLNLSRAMAYKNALAGLDLGGGKAVIIGDPATDKSEALLRAYGRFVQSLGGRYFTACDVGTYSEDMDVIARESALRDRPHAGQRRRRRLLDPHRLRRVPGHARRRRARLRHAHAARPAGRRRGRGQGRPPPGGPASSRTAPRWSICDVERAGRRARTAAPPARWRSWPTRRSSPTADIDVYAPCALGGALDDDTRRPRLRATIVCGGANNQLAHPGVEKQLADRGILYAPDYVVNSGGVIQVADEIEGFNMERARAKATQIYDTTLKIFAIAAEEGVPPAVAADRLAERRMSEVGRIRGIWLGR